MTLTDWPDASMSPFRLIPWRQACSDLDCSSNTVLRLLAQHGISTVVLTKRKRAVLARDLVRLVHLKQRPAETYAAAGVQEGNA